MRIRRRYASIEMAGTFRAWKHSVALGELSARDDAVRRLDTGGSICGGGSAEEVERDDDEVEGSGGATFVRKLLPRRRPSGTGLCAPPRLGMKPATPGRRASTSLRRSTPGVTGRSRASSSPSSPSSLSELRRDRRKRGVTGELSGAASNVPLVRSLSLPRADGLAEEVAVRWLSASLACAICSRRDARRRRRSAEGYETMSTCGGEGRAGFGFGSSAAGVSRAGSGSTANGGRELDDSGAPASSLSPAGAPSDSIPGPGSVSTMASPASSSAPAPPSRFFPPPPPSLPGLAVVAALPIDLGFSSTSIELDARAEDSGDRDEAEEEGEELAGETGAVEGWEVEK